METNNINPSIPNNGKTIAGIIILVIGGILLMKQFDFLLIPHWLLSWPMWMIAYGVYMGGKYNFKKPIWIWTTVLGVAFLLTENMHHAGQFIWPLSVIGLGAWIIVKHNNKQANAPYQGNDQKEF